MRIPLSRLRLLIVWLLIPPFFYFAQPRPGLLLAGAAVALLGLAMRAWAAGTIVKNRQLATEGPYTLTRNPLYLGSFLMGLGLSLGSGHPLIALVFVIGFTALYLPLMRQEEARLEELFGAPFRDYAARVPLFLPRPSSLRHLRRGSFTRERYVGHREWEALIGVAAGFVLLIVRMQL